MTNVGGAIASGRTGLFYHRTRFLDVLDFKVAGRQPECASANLISSDRLTAFYLCRIPGGARNGPAAGDRKSEIVRRGVELDLTAELAESLRLIFRLTNHGLETARLPLSWELSTDFLDQADIGPHRRRGPVPVQRRWDDTGVLSLRHLRPELRHETRIGFTGETDFFEDAERVRCEIKLPSQAQANIELLITPIFDPRLAHELPKRSKRAPDDQAWSDACARLETCEPAVQTAWDRAAGDLRALQLGDGEGEERFTPAAGAPNYIALFGRDALVAGWQSLLLNPATLRGSLGLVGAWTATTYDPKFDAQPGKVLHQRQLGPRALSGKTPFRHYYGDHSASGLFLTTLASAFAWSGDAGFFGSFRDLALRTLDWLDRDGDLDGDGFYEYQNLAGPEGLKNQGWKDSNDAILYPDGQLVPDPIALCEIQALFYAAKRAMAAAFRCVGEDRLADDLAGQAAALKRRFNETFWMPDEGFLGLALDPAKTLVRTIASNPGDCLAYGIVDEDKAVAIADRLMRKDLYSGWGIRTLGASHPAFNPLGYHIGSVWPSSNAITARGFARYGFSQHLHTLARGLFEASRLFELSRLPELFGGHRRDADHPHPGLYPDACSPQAWSAGAVILLVDTLAGLRPAAPLGALVMEPKLPDWLPALTLRGVQVGRGRMSLRLSRQADGSAVCQELENSSGLKLLTPASLALPSANERAAIDFAEALP